MPSVTPLLAWPPCQVEQAREHCPLYLPPPDTHNATSRLSISLSSSLLRTAVCGRQCSQAGGAATESEARESGRGQGTERVREERDRPT